MERSNQELIQDLHSSDPVVRQNAREELVRRDGPQVVRALVVELTDPRQQVRWEAAKALGEIADPVAAPALVNELADEDPDVRWVAGEGLIAMGEAGLLTVLSELPKRAASVAFREGAHHVLHELKNERNAAVVQPVLDALRGPEPGVNAPPVAADALWKLRGAHPL
ncbi:MAG: HEAT repeat domain-containing protein [Planctomycetota bacterium]|nr:MAG: HEAT repeat domain-containing protein [Planctomycetota bacterium]